MAARGEKRLMKEFADFQKKPIEGVTVSLVNDSVFNWELKIAGPAGTPYEGGIFVVSMVMPPEYPQKAPEVTFKTKIYHVNINKEEGKDFGKACIKIINNWAPSVGLSRVVTDLVGMLANPNGESAQDVEMGSQFLNDRPAFDAIAKQWVAQYAK